MNYKGSCHCGKVAFEVDGEINGATACNCCMCSRNGSRLWFVARDQFENGLAAMKSVVEGTSKQ